MIVAKFVTDAFESPGRYGTLTYTPGTTVEVTDYDPAEKGQCAAGIHVIPLTPDADFCNVIFSDRVILLEVDESDIIYREGNGKMRVRKVHVLPVEESTRETFLIGAEWAYVYAHYIDKCSRDDTRNAVLSDPRWDYLYAYLIDKCSRNDTRNAVLSDPGWAYFYACNVDNCSRNDTRNAVLSDPCWAYYYAFNVEKCPHEDIRNSVQQNKAFADAYNSWSKVSGIKWLPRPVVSILTLLLEPWW